MEERKLGLGLGQVRATVRAGLFWETGTHEEGLGDCRVASCLHSPLKAVNLSCMWGAW